MKSAVPKVLHTLCGRPMIHYVLDLVKKLKAAKTVVVLGHKHEEVRKELPAGVTVAVQKKLLGTADAVKAGLSRLGPFAGTVLILYGDTPLLTYETTSRLLKYHTENNLDATLLTAESAKPEGYGRILRDSYAGVCGIVEDKDADDAQKDIKEINTGIMCFNKKSLARALRRVKPNNRKKEYYLTDCIGLLYKDEGLVDAIKTKNTDEAMGINSRVELAKAIAHVRQRINERFMKEGVTLIDPASTFISFDAKIGPDTTIYPFTVIETNVTIGARCLVGPFAHLREGVRLQDEVLVGNFVEMARARVGTKTWAKHFCYVGDSQIGERVNIGAGTVTANFDGKNKNQTRIGSDAFIGSDSILVAPLRIGKKATTGAGTVVTRNVSDKTTVVGVPARFLRRG
ncbi:MAG: NTP transferase domain-containing protein [Candidatus Omnitrophica bacterium]|nr:NTP transferase domain-containing protein [Candidatus Omnitrophota bacterium]